MAYQRSRNNNGEYGAPKDGKKKWLSHTGLEVLSRCPRCFWLKYNKGIYQPEGIVSRLPDRFDRVIKAYFGPFRLQGVLPPLIENKVEGKLENPFQETYFYSIDDKYGFYGKLDECLVAENKTYTPVDFKTSSSDPREKELLAAYKNQVDEYAFLLEANKKPTTGIAHLIYFYPDMSETLHNGFPMIVHVATLQTDPLVVEDRIDAAIKVLESPVPESSKECPFCEWRTKVNKELTET